jgi:uncharacterized membrane protein
MRILYSKKQPKIAPADYPSVNTLLAVISGDALVSAVFTIVIIALVVWVALWAVDKAGTPQPWHKVITVLVIVAAAFWVINVLLGLIGHPIVA